MATVRTLTRNGMNSEDNKPATPKGSNTMSNSEQLKQQIEEQRHSPTIRGISSIAPAELVKQQGVTVESLKEVPLMFLSTEFKMFPPNQYTKEEHEVAIVTVRRLDNNEVVKTVTENWIPFQQLKAIQNNPEVYPFTGMFWRNPENKNSAWEITDLPEGEEVQNSDIPF